MKKRLLLTGVIAIAMLVAVLALDRTRRGAPSTREAFAGDATRLMRTVVVPTLETEIPPGKSALWCASLALAWRELEDGVAKGPVSVPGAESLVRQLEADAASVRSDVPAETFYAAGGWAKEGIADVIRRSVVQKFPGAPPPDFDTRAVAIAFARVEANVRFALPYFESRKAVVWKDSSGKATRLSSFGLRPEDESSFYELRKQCAVLYERDEAYELVEFAVDLDQGSNPTQVIVARIPRADSLAETIAQLESKIAAQTPKSAAGSHHPRKLGSSGVLLVPNMCFEIEHHLAELENKPSPLGGFVGSLKVLQSIRFRLDRNGAELASEARIEYQSMGDDFVVDGPFLVLMRKRGCSRPFFAVWVDNAELLSPF